MATGGTSRCGTLTWPGGVTPTELTTLVTAYDPVGNVINLSPPSLATYACDQINQLVSESHMSRGLTTWGI